jgi:aspartate aminotransferase
MSLSQIARSLRESATLKLNETAALLREKGEPVIHLAGGEPKSKAPIDAVINCTSLHRSRRLRCRLVFGCDSGTS